MERFVKGKVDSTDDIDVVQKLWETYQIQGLPMVVFIDSNGAVSDSPRVAGFVGPTEFLGELTKVK